MRAMAGVALGWVLSNARIELPRSSRRPLVKWRRRFLSNAGAERPSLLGNLLFRFVVVCDGGCVPRSSAAYDFALS